ncbi:phospholipase-like protein [Tanacetum coccineum]
MTRQAQNNLTQVSLVKDVIKALRDVNLSLTVVAILYLLYIYLDNGKFAFILSKVTNAGLFSDIPIDSSLTLSHFFFVDDTIFVEEVGAAATTMGCSIFTTHFVHLGVKVGAIYGEDGALNFPSSLSKHSPWLDIICEDPSLDDLALKHKFSILYALDNYKQITVVKKINHASMVDTFLDLPGVVLRKNTPVFFYPAWMLIDDSILPKEEVATRNQLLFGATNPLRELLFDDLVPRVLVTCRRRQIYDENVPLYYHINKDFSIPFGREEFCLVTGLRFGVQNWAEYDTKQRIPFRRRVFPSYLDGQPITGIDIANMILDESFAQLYDDDAVGLCCLGILQLVILGVESKRVVPDWMLRLANDRVAWDKYPWGSYVWPTLYSQLRNANVKRWSPLYVDEPTDEDDAKKYSIFGYTWAFKTWILESYRVTAIRYFDRYNRYPRVAAWNKKKGRFLGPMVIPFFEGNMPAARLTPDDNEARSDWWISSRAYFDGFIGQVERVPFDLSRQNMYEIPSDIYREFDEQKREIERNKKEVDNIKEEMRKFREEMNVQPVRQENKEPIIADQHYGLSDFTQFQSTHGGPSSFQGHVNSSYFNMGTPPNFQTPMQSQPGSSVWQRKMPVQSATQYWQPDTSSQPGSYYLFGRVPSHIGYIQGNKSGSCGHGWKQSDCADCIGICKGETGPCWSWWMSVLKECIGDNPNLLFISDRHAAIALAVEKEFPLASQAVCCRHLMNEPRIENTKEKVYLENMQGIYTRRLCNEHEHTTNFQPDAHEKLCRAGP